MLPRRYNIVGSNDGHVVGQKPRQKQYLCQINFIFWKTDLIFNYDKFNYLRAANMIYSFIFYSLLKHRLAYKFSIVVLLGQFLPGYTIISAEYL